MGKDTSHLRRLIDKLTDRKGDDTNQEHKIQRKMLESPSTVCSTRGRACLELYAQQLAEKCYINIKLFVQGKSPEYWDIRTSEHNLLKIQRSIYNADQKFMVSTVMSVLGESTLKSIPVLSAVFMQHPGSTPFTFTNYNIDLSYVMRLSCNLRLMFESDDEIYSIIVAV